MLDVLRNKSQVSQFLNVDSHAIEIHITVCRTTVGITRPCRILKGNWKLSPILELWTAFGRHRKEEGEPDIDRETVAAGKVGEPNRRMPPGWQAVFREWWWQPCLHGYLCGIAAVLDNVGFLCQRRHVGGSLSYGIGNSGHVYKWTQVGHGCVLKSRSASVPWRCLIAVII